MANVTIALPSSPVAAWSIAKGVVQLGPSLMEMKIIYIPYPSPKPFLLLLKPKTRPQIYYAYRKQAFDSMTWYTCAVGCKSRQGKSGVHFYRFPTDVKKSETWIAAIKRRNWAPTECSRVCSAHFVSGVFHL